MAFQTAQVPFKLTPQDMGRPDYLSAISKGIGLGYQPKMTQAEIFHKTMEPLATIASNQMLWGLMGPEQQQRMTEMIGNMMSGYGGGGTFPGASQNGAMPSMNGSMNNNAPMGSMPQNSQMQGGQQQMPMQNNPQQNSPSLDTGLVAGTGADTRTGALAKLTAPFHAQVQEPGVVAYNPKTSQIISTPSQSTVSDLQQSSLAIKNVMPLLNKLIGQSKDILKPGGKAAVGGSMISGILSNLGVPEDINPLGSSALASKNADFIATQNTTIERLLSSLSLPRDQESVHMLKQIVQPQIGETQDGYAQRLSNEINSLASRHSQNQQALFGGINVTPGEQQGLPGNNQIAQQLINSQPAQQEGLGQVSREGVVEQAKKIKGKEYHKINGQWLPVIG